MADFKENYKKNVGKTVLELFKKVLNVKKDYVNKQNQLSNDLQTGGSGETTPQTQAQTTPQTQTQTGENNVVDKMYELIYEGGKKTHDLGEIPASYGLDGLFVADLGGTDLKFLGKNNSEQKYENPKKKRDARLLWYKW